MKKQNTSQQLRISFFCPLSVIFHAWGRGSRLFRQKSKFWKWNVGRYFEIIPDLTFILLRGSLFVFRIRINNENTYIYYSWKQDYSIGIDAMQKQFILITSTVIMISLFLSVTIANICLIRVVFFIDTASRVKFWRSVARHVSATFTNRWPPLVAPVSPPPAPPGRGRRRTS